MSNPARQPYLGEMVHYVSYGTPGGEYSSVCRAAMITECPGDSLASVMVFNPTGLFMHPGLQHDEDRVPGTYHWQH